MGCVHYTPLPFVKSWICWIWGWWHTHEKSCHGRRQLFEPTKTFEMRFSRFHVYWILAHSSTMDIPVKNWHIFQISVRIPSTHFFGEKKISYTINKEIFFSSKKSVLGIRPQITLATINAITIVFNPFCTHLFFRRKKTILPSKGSIQQKIARREIDSKNRWID